MTSSPARCRCESFSGVLHLVTQLHTCRLSTPTTPSPHPVELYWRLNQKSELPPKEATSTPNNFNFVERSASANLASASRVGPTKRRPTKRRLPCDLFLRSISCLATKNVWGSFLLMTILHIFLFSKKFKHPTIGLPLRFLVNREASWILETKISAGRPAKQKKGESLTRIVFQPSIF